MTTNGICKPHVDPPYREMAALPSLRTPPPRASGDAGLALIPVFTSVYHRPENVIAYLRAAIYSRVACLQNTDAVQAGVPVYLYLEDTVLDRYIHILFENHIDFEKDVIVFSAPPAEKAKGGVWGQYSKKLCVYVDPRFAQVPWVVAWDADVFFPKGTHFSFRHIFRMPTPDIAYVRLKDKRCWRDWQAVWERRFQQTVAKSDIPFSHYTEVFGELGHFRPDDEIYYPSGYLWAYPAKHFHTLNTDFVWWMSHLMPYVGDDELMLSLAAYRFDFPIHSLQQMLAWDLRTPHEFSKAGQATLYHGHVKDTPLFLERLGLADGTDSFSK